MKILGIDIGGTGIKGAPVDIASGTLVADRYRVKTPQPATPEAVAAAVAALSAHFDWKGPIGCGVPAVVQHGRVLTAANIDRSWIGTDARTLLGQATGCPVEVYNDADAAGYAEMHFGAGRERAGVVIIVTLGTGIGSAVFVNGHLVTNTELGHLLIAHRRRGLIAAEKWASERVRVQKGLSWKKWALRVDLFLHELRRYLWPDLFIIGGGVSKRADKFLPHLTVQTEVRAANLRNEAGIIGAALAYEHARRRVVRQQGGKGEGTLAAHAPAEAPKPKAKRARKKPS